MKKNILIIIFTLLVVGLGIYIYIDAKNGYGIKNKNIKEDSIILGGNVYTNTKEEKVEPKVDTKVETKVETKEEPKVETKVETKEETKVETKVEPKVETKVETKVEEPKVETKEETKVETKEEIIKEEIITIKQEPVAYFLAESKVIETANEQDEGLKERAKKTFINIVDFIFYDKPINGYRFSELTSEAKLKIIEIALNIDSKIDTKFPNYKDKIKENFNNAKGKLGVKYLEVSAKICDSMGEYKCNLAKESFNNLKKSFSFTVELVKELTKSGSQKVKEMYEKFRG